MTIRKIVTGFWFWKSVRYAVIDENDQEISWFYSEAAAKKSISRHKYTQYNIEFYARNGVDYGI